MTDQRGEFGKAPPEDWAISRSVSAQRRSHLLNAPSFDCVVQRMCSEFSVVEHKRERHKKERDFYRFASVLKCDSGTVDVFFNSSSGYRAQYFLGITKGERANLYACDAIGKAVLAHLNERLKRTCTKAEWLHKSIAGQSAKLWIHQGMWLRYAKSSDRNLEVPRWQENGARLECARAEKLSRWSALIPNSENRVVFKGGYWTLDGKIPGPQKESRSKEIHLLGFT